MTFPYLARLVCLCLACFFAVNLAASLAAKFAVRPAIAIAERVSARHAARLLLSLRLFPAAFGLLVVAALCVPSYLWLEPHGDAERTGFVCIAAALLGAAVWGASMTRALKSIVVSRSATRQWKHVAREIRAGGERCWLTDDSAPRIALAGIVRPRVVVSNSILSALAPDQLDAAIRHERAHAASRDNLKRLLIRLAPAALPFTPTFETTLDRAWARFTEWSADDAATAGDPARSVALAAALVRVARMSFGPQLELASSLLADPSGLAARVERLLRPATSRERRGQPRWVVAGGAIGMLLAGVLFAPASLASVHAVLEHLMR